jgi:hypothetical protein
LKAPATQATGRPSKPPPTPSSSRPGRRARPAKPSPSPAAWPTGSSASAPGPTARAT